MSTPKTPDYSKFKEVYMSAWEQVFQRLDKLESETRVLRQKIEKLERKSEI